MERSALRAPELFSEFPDQLCQEANDVSFGTSNRVAHGRKPEHGCCRRVRFAAIAAEAFVFQRLLRTEFCSILPRLLLSLRPGQPRCRNAADLFRFPRRPSGLPKRRRKSVSNSTLLAAPWNRDCLFLYKLRQTTLAIRHVRIDCGGLRQSVLDPADHRQPG